MKINEIDIDELHQIYSDYDGNELYNDTRYISYNYYEKEYDCLKIEDYSADLQCFKNKNIGTAWLENKLNMDEVDNLLKVHNNFLFDEYGEKNQIYTIDTLPDPVIGVAYSTAFDSENKYEYDVQVSYDLVNQQELNEVFNGKVWGKQTINLSITDYTEALQINAFDDFYSFAVSDLHPDKLNELLENKDNKVVQNEYQELFDKRDIVIKYRYDVEVTQTLQKTYTIFAESESVAIDEVQKGLNDEFNLTQDDSANQFTEVSIFDDGIEEKIEMEL